MLDIPVEIYLEIFNYISDPRTYLNLNLSCRYFHRICKNNNLLKKCFLNNIKKEDPHLWNSLLKLRDFLKEGSTFIIVRRYRNRIPINRLDIGLLDSWITYYCDKPQSKNPLSLINNQLYLDMDPRGYSLTDFDILKLSENGFLHQRSLLAPSELNFLISKDDILKLK